MINLKIGIERLRIDASVGIYENEKRARQDVFVSARLLFADATIEIDDMKQSVDYDALCGEIRRTVNARHYELIENMGLCIARNLKTFARCQQVDVRIDKPLAAEKNGAESIFIEVAI